MAWQARKIKRYGSRFPTGKDGALFVDFFDTVTIPAGAIKDYSSVNIQGILQILSGSAWTMIGCKGDFNLDGTIQAFSNPLDGTFTATAPDGTALSYSVIASEGGEGGESGYGPIGGLATNGCGGGGSGAAPGNNAQPTQGGRGGDGTENPGGNIPGGNGASDPSNIDAENGQDANSTLGDAVGSGGGGGFRGSNGQGLYLNIKGNCSGTGVIYAGSIGLDGGLGGGGGNGDTPTGSGYGGGGGGGGGGGQGGKCVIRYHGTAPTWSIGIDGGVSGNGGGGGIGTGAVDSVDGGTGFPGTDGASGSSVITHY